MVCSLTQTEKEKCPGGTTAIPFEVNSGAGSVQFMLFGLMHVAPALI